MKRAYVVGSGPNGLTAAIVLAKAGLSVTVLEAQPTIGGGTRSSNLTLPGFVHDVCSAVHPMALSSPAFVEFPLAAHGLEWIQPPAAVAHPLDDGTAVLMKQSIDETVDLLGSDGKRYRRFVSGFASRWKDLTAEILGPLRFPRSPLLYSRFGAIAPLPASMVARLAFRGERARALFAGVAAHSVLPLDMLGSAAFGLVLSAAAHAVGWPIPKGGSQSIANALASYLQSLGGIIAANSPVTSLQELREADLVLCDVTPRQFLAMAGEHYPGTERRGLERYRYGPGVYKMDWALSAPIPWTASDCAQAATVHIGGTLKEITDAEKAPWEQALHPRPFVLLVQPSLFDSTRAPAGRHTAWAYCHVPNGSKSDVSRPIEDQIERFAPGFRKTILARSIMTPGDLERHNANLVGGDITGGAQDLGQLFLRPTRRLYRTALKNVYLCSASTPPGGAVHGMCGYHAARTALRDIGLRPR